MLPNTNKTRGFTIIELLVVIGILAVLATATTLIINPAELNRISRDARRVADIDALNKNIDIYFAQGGNAFGLANTVYISLPDISVGNDNCNTSTGGTGYSLPSLPTPWKYWCASSANYRSVTGNGWIPVDLSSVPGLAPAKLPIDPINSSTDNSYYTYIGGSWSLTARMESTKFLRDTNLSDGGTDPARYEAGTDKALWTSVSGLVGYWPMDEGSGQITTDSSGNANNGSLGASSAIETDDPAWASGKIGWALSFDGAEDYVNANDINLIDTAVALSGCAWSYPESMVVDNGILTKGGSGLGGFLFFRDDFGAVSGRTDIYTIFMAKTGGVSYVRIEGSTNSAKSNTWAHICFTYKENVVDGLRLYIDGKEDANSPVSTVGFSGIDSGSNILSIGRRLADTNSPFDGLIDDVRIYSRALSATEIQAIYNATK